MLWLFVLAAVKKWVNPQKSSKTIFSILKDTVALNVTIILKLQLAAKNDKPQ
jgi:arginine exporter protein ArgO